MFLMQATYMAAEIVFSIKKWRDLDTEKYSLSQDLTSWLESIAEYKSFICEAHGLAD